MTYEEFARRCDDRGITRPTYDEYINIIEPVYTYHPAFDGNFAKDRCAEIYKAGGLGVFFCMSVVAEMAKEMEIKGQNLRNNLTKVVHEEEAKERELNSIKKLKNEIAEQIREADEEMLAFRESVRQLWGCE